MTSSPRAIVLLPLLTLLAGCAGQVVSPTDKSLIDQADQLHLRLAPAILDDRDPRLKRYLGQLATRVTAAAKELDQQGTIKSPAEGSKAWMFGKDVEFHLVNSDLPNAFASGGRHVYVYNGLFQQCETEDELAAVACHAYAHLYARHVQQVLRREQGLNAEQALLFPFVTLQLTPAQERAADTIAFNVYTRAGWDPGRFVAIYEQLYNGNTPGVDRNHLREKTVDVIDRLLPAVPASSREWAQPPIADDVRFAQLQAQTKSAVAAAPRANQPQLLLAAFPNCLSPTPTPAQARARQTLFPPPPAPPTGDNQWGKGVGGGGR